MKPQPALEPRLAILGGSPLGALLGRALWRLPRAWSIPRRGATALLGLVMVATLIAAREEGGSLALRHVWRGWVGGGLSLGLSIGSHATRLQLASEEQNDTLRLLTLTVPRGRGLAAALAMSTLIRQLETLLVLVPLIVLALVLGLIRPASLIWLPLLAPFLGLLGGLCGVSGAVQPPARSRWTQRNSGGGAEVALLGWWGASMIMMPGMPLGWGPDWVAGILNPLLAVTGPWWQLPLSLVLWSPLLWLARERAGLAVDALSHAGLPDQRPLWKQRTPADLPGLLALVLGLASVIGLGFSPQAGAWAGPSALILSWFLLVFGASWLAHWLSQSLAWFLRGWRARSGRQSEATSEVERSGRTRRSLLRFLTPQAPVQAVPDRGTMRVWARWPMVWKALMTRGRYGRFGLRGTVLLTVTMVAAAIALSFFPTFGLPWLPPLVSAITVWRVASVERAPDRWPLVVLTGMRRGELTAGVAAATLRSAPAVLPLLVAQYPSFLRFTRNQGLAPGQVVLRGVIGVGWSLLWGVALTLLMARSQWFRHTWQRFVGTCLAALLFLAMTVLTVTSWAVPEPLLGWLGVPFTLPWLQLFAEPGGLLLSPLILPLPALLMWFSLRPGPRAA